ncbi:uncharacterized protein METZ01_LOCUS88710, partial [marine metagenome]
VVVDAAAGKGCESDTQGTITHVRTSQAAALVMG